jgi:hypothetical protein
MIGIVGLTQTDPLLLLHEHHGKEEGQIATTIPATIEEEVQNPGGGNSLLLRNCSILNKYPWEDL